MKPHICYRCGHNDYEIKNTDGFNRLVCKKCNAFQRVMPDLEVKIFKVIKRGVAGYEKYFPSQKG